MEENFEDIFESINSLHKKYSSKEYRENIDNFNENSKELERILEKYRTDKKCTANEDNKNKKLKKVLY